MELLLLEDGTYEYDGKNYSKENLAALIKNGVFVNIAKKQGGKIDINTSNLINITKHNRYGNVQKIIFGPPGTGKSYFVNNIIRQSYENYDQSTGNSEFVYRTAIHPNFDYNEFVGSIMPVVEVSGGNKSIAYDFTPGIFTQALCKSLYTNNDVYLVLEEMSRGNISEIFGDIFQLLDRDVSEKSSYAISNLIISKYITDFFKSNGMESPITNDNIFLPANFHIIGTVNTSDQNVYVMDTAFKRRFEMEYMSLTPIKDESGEYLNNHLILLPGIDTDWVHLYQKLNRFILQKLKLSEDKQLGQFFLQFKYKANYNFDILDRDVVESLEKYIMNWNKKQYQDKLLMYLWQDVHKATIVSTHKLFNSQYTSVEDLLSAVIIGEKIFSKEFYEFDE